eukprot:6457790-Amphidinium_carterae.2
MYAACVIAQLHGLLFIFFANHSSIHVTVTNIAWSYHMTRKTTNACSRMAANGFSREENSLEST